MKIRYILPLVLSLAFSTRSNALYSDTIPRTKTPGKIRLTNGAFLNGYIIGADDSSITYVKKADWKKKLYTHSETVAAENIDGVTKRYKSGMTVGEGLLVGGLGGIILGFSLGLASDCEDEDGDGHCDFAERLFATRNFTLSLFLGSLLGLGGMIVGLFSRKKDKTYYHIGGSRDNIRNNKIGLTF